MNAPLLNTASPSDENMQPEIRRSTRRSTRTPISQVLTTTTSQQAAEVDDCAPPSELSAVDESVPDVQSHYISICASLTVYTS